MAGVEDGEAGTWVPGPDGCSEAGHGWRLWLCDPPKGKPAACRHLVIEGLVYGRVARAMRHGRLEPDPREMAIWQRRIAMRMFDALQRFDKGVSGCEQQQGGHVSCVS
jgi:hypothetical protein